MGLENRRAIIETHWTLTKHEYSGMGLGCKYRVGILESLVGHKRSHWQESPGADADKAQTRKTFSIPVARNSSKHSHSAGQPGYSVCPHMLGILCVRRSGWCMCTILRRSGAIMHVWRAIFNLCHTPNGELYQIHPSYIIYLNSKAAVCPSTLVDKDM